MVGVGQQDHVVDSERGEDLRAGAVAAHRVSRHRRFARAKVDRARQRAGRGGVKRDDDPRAFVLDHPHRALKHARLRARFAKNVGEQVEAVHPDQHRRRRIDRAVDQRELLLAARFVAEDLGLPFGAAARR